MLKVLISLGKSFYQAFPDLGDWLREEGIQVTEQVSADQEPSREQRKSLLRDVQIYIVGVDRVDEEIMDAAPDLKLIIKHGVGYDNIDLEAAKKRGIAVTYAKGENAQSVAELTMGLILAACRGIARGDREVHNQVWNLFMGCELSGKNLGLIGYGNIGRRVAKIARGFGMKVYACDPWVSEEELKREEVYPADFETLLETADFLSLHIPVTETTRHLINEEAFQRMKTSAYLINTARGELVDETALKKALKEGQIRGAAVDVFQKEPPDPSLALLKEAVFTPHLGACTVDSARRLSFISFENVMNFINQRPLKNRLV